MIYGAPIELAALAFGDAADLAAYIDPAAEAVTKEHAGAEYETRESAARFWRTAPPFLSPADVRSINARAADRTREEAWGRLVSTTTERLRTATLGSSGRMGSIFGPQLAIEPAHWSFLAWRDLSVGTAEGGGETLYDVRVYDPAGMTLAEAVCAFASREALARSLRALIACELTDAVREAAAAMAEEACAHLAAGRLVAIVNGVIIEADYWRTWRIEMAPPAEGGRGPLRRSWHIVAATDASTAAPNALADLRLWPAAVAPASIAAMSGAPREPAPPGRSSKLHGGPLDAADAPLLVEMHGLVLGGLRPMTAAKEVAPRASGSRHGDSTVQRLYRKYLAAHPRTEPN